MVQHRERERAEVPEGMVRLARIGKPHALRGEVTVQLHTDDPDGRLGIGAVLQTAPAEEGPLTVSSHRVHQGITLLGFEEVPDRTAAERMRGVVLVGPSESEQTDDEGYYPAELEGLEVVDAAGEPLGTVVTLHLRPAQDILEIRLPGGHQPLVPFVEELVPTIDLEAGRVTVTAPAGLLEPLD